MKALELLKELIINMSSLNEDGYMFGRLRTYKAIEELEALEIKLKQGQENYDKLWDMYSELKKELGNRTCESCRHKYVFDSMTTECRHDDSPIDYLDLDCFPDFCCNKYEPKENK